MGIAATIPALAEGLIFQGKKSVEPILKTENLWKLYRAGKVDVPALRGVNFGVQPGESVAVMGPSGCGKSTMLHVIGGLAQATRGRVLLDVKPSNEREEAYKAMKKDNEIGIWTLDFVFTNIDRVGGVA